MQPHQQRVATEKTELDTKLTALRSFIQSSLIFTSLPAEERERLVRQESCMTEYSGILAERIATF